LFATEYATEPVDVAWLREVDARHEAEYKRAKRGLDAEKGKREQALREELQNQDRQRDPRDLERRFAKQEREREQRKQDAREERERQRIEARLAVGAGPSGFHYTDQEEDDS
jgi:hypothetical protein